ncbi:MAG: serine hydrolase, partial [Planctomycetota bacterium]
MSGCKVVFLLSVLAARNGELGEKLDATATPLIGILLADAVERGIVELEDPAQRHLPPESQVPAFEGEPIRLVRLSTHTWGLGARSRSRAAVCARSPASTASMPRRRPARRAEKCSRM